MSLVKNVINLNFEQGINNGIDQLQIPLGKFESLININNEDTNIKKRVGYAPLTNVITDNTTITSSKDLLSFQDQLLLTDNNNKIYSYSETGIWTERGSLPNIEINIEPVVINGITQSNIQSYVQNNKQLIIYKQSSNYYLVINSTDNKKILPPTLISIISDKYKICSMNGYWYIFVLAINKLRVYKINELSNFNSLSHIEYSKDYDIVDFDIQKITNTKINISLITASTDPTPNVLLAFSIYSSGVSSGSVVYDILLPLSVKWVYNKNQDEQDEYNCNSHLMVGKGAYYSFIKINSYLSFLDSYESSVEYDSKVKISWVDNDTISVIVNEEAVDEVPYHTIKYNVNYSTTVEIATSYGHNTYSEPFYYNENYYYITTTQVELQNCYWLIQDGAGYLSRFCYQTGGTPSLNEIPVCSRTDEGVVISITEIILNENIESVKNCFIKFTNLNKKSFAEINNSLMISGSLLKTFDGSICYEHGFLMYPEYVDLVATTGGALSTGTYNYQVVFEWYDNQGQLYQSVPSTIKPITLSAGETAVTITFRHLYMTEKTNVKICIYRSTIATPLVLQKLETYDKSEINNPLTASGTYTDILSDADIADNAFIYTYGGMLDIITPSSAKIIRVYKNRAFIVTFENSTQIWFSKVWTLNEAISFSDFQIIQMVKDSEPIVDLQVIDDRLIIFKTNSIYTINGEGPGDDGNNSDYGYPSKISSFGCSEVSSILSVNNGFIFKGIKGFYLLDKSLTIVYIGYEIKNFNNFEVISSLFSKNNIAKFFINDKKVLKFNTDKNIWSTDEFNFNCSDMININNVNYISKTDGIVLKETDDIYFDDTNKIISSFETGWINLAGINGLERLYKIMIVGKYLGSHSLKVSLKYDYVDSIVDNFLINNTEEVYGDGDYGDDEVYGGYPIVQFYVRPSKQKCGSFKIRIEDYYSNGISTAGFAISAISLEVGAKRSLKPLKS